MKEAFGGISLFQIVILFILLFTGIMCLTINHAKAFGVKDEIITIIQNENLASNVSVDYELSSNTINSIVLELSSAGYRLTGECPNDWIGYTRDGIIDQNNASFCIKANNVTESFYNDIDKKCRGDICYPTYSGYPKMVYYDVMLFYQLDIPIINNIMQFEVIGSTKVLFG